MKKLLLLIVASIATSAHACEQNPLDVVLNPKIKCVCNLDLRGTKKLAHQNLAGKKFVSVDFSGIPLDYTDLSGCTFVDCFFVDTDVYNAILNDARFICCNLLNIRNWHKSPEGHDQIFDAVSRVTIPPFSQELPQFYLKKGDTVPQLNIPVSGLCLRKYNEAKEASNSSSSSSSSDH
jgi:hypothetical protein